MCRWAAYLGEAIFLEEIVTAPSHSLIVQSRDAREAKSPTNADGFGLAWYGGRPEPGLYRDILPAWSDPNLKSLCQQIRSGLFLAHVRASTDGGTSRVNCHPFISGRWSFMHNGQIHGFERIRRGLENSLSDAVYDRRSGSTDSELFFLLMIDEGLSRDPHGAATRAANRVLDASRRAGLDPALKLTAAFSDGKALYAVRYATDDHAPTLYTSAFGRGRCIVSEPFDREGGEWQTIPPSSFVTIARDGMVVRPFTPALAELALAG
ncbi:MAG: class II glutamine amidotransferase [Mesorhizobium sp.]|uniref:class II glutamine amidotransferase n=1 Tax=Mesorhizobium sp. TaxID=1871066 RepID=UPI000FE9D6ED|nr:class II glutamine amidotransferase [Mesorhizobium sp.]RWD27819.1 MAG: class II glutamine amidotransferase [Mesorhizobium sp.]TJW70663.1 MAG: class II glutamine amidotransferase [Mesorhizobium sp.]